MFIGLWDQYGTHGGAADRIKSLVVPEEAASNLINCLQVALWVMHQAPGFEKQPAGLALH